MLYCVCFLHYRYFEKPTYELYLTLQVCTESWAFSRLYLHTQQCKEWITVVFLIYLIEYTQYCKHKIFYCVYYFTFIVTQMPSNSHPCYHQPCFLSEGMNKS